MIDAKTANELTISSLSPVDNTTKRIVEKLLKFIDKGIRKQCKKGLTKFQFETNYYLEILEEAKLQLEALGFRVDILGPYLLSDYRYTMKVVW